MAPTLTEHPPTDDTDEGKPWSRSSKIQLLALIAVGGFWVSIYAYTLLSGPHRPIGQMEDTAFATAAEPICAAAATDIAALGLPTAVESPAERAELVIAENDLLRTMLGDLGALDRPAGEEGEWASEWLDDWAVHVDDRQRWADDLLAGDDHPFVETARRNEQISKGIDFFAETNDMPSCVSSGDV